MLKVYRHPELGFPKGRFKRPASDPDMTIDCSSVIASPDSTQNNEAEITFDDIKH